MKNNNISLPVLESTKMVRVRDVLKFVKTPNQVKNSHKMASSSKPAFRRRAIGNSRLNDIKMDKKFLYKYKLSSKKRLSSFKLKFIGRPYNFYSFILAKRYLTFNLIIRPNNIFAAYSEISVKKNNPSINVNGKKLFTQAFRKEYQLLVSKKASDFGIDFSKRGVKGKTFDFLSKFVSKDYNLNMKQYGFVVIDLTTPKHLRKKNYKFFIEVAYK